MPRTADHEERRRQIAGAVEQIIVSEGFDKLTVARTAATAGISVGLVQHYFSSKDALLLFTFGSIRDRVEARVAATIERLETAGARVEHSVRESLTELLPIDDAHRRECAVNLAFVGRTLDNPELAAAWSSANTSVRSRLARAIRNAKKCGEAAPDTDEEGEAGRLLAYTEGLALHSRVPDQGLSSASATAGLAAVSHAVFPGECHHPSSLSA